MFGDRLRELREDRSLTQDQLAEHLKITRQQLSSYENGRFEPNMDTLVSIADFFDVSLDYLLGRTKAKYNLSFTKNKEKLILQFKKLMDEYI